MRVLCEGGFILENLEDLENLENRAAHTYPPAPVPLRLN